MTISNARKSELLDTLKGWERKRMGVSVGSMIGNLEAYGKDLTTLKNYGRWFLIRSSVSRVTSYYEVEITREEMDFLLDSGVEYNRGSVSLDRF